MNRVVMFSGGLGSRAAAKRVAAQHGTADMVLLFTDTLIEDEDLYRFLDEAAADVGAPLIKLAEGRTPWQVFHDVKFLGNSRVDPCSKILKRQIADAWLRDNRDPQDTTVYVGIDWTEEHRFDDGKGGGLRPRRAAAGWRYEAPLCAPPFVTKLELFAALADAGIQPPRLYGMGFAHNNCGGFCVKAGIGHFALLLEKMPVRYIEHEIAEDAFIQFIGKPVSMMADRRGDGKKKQLTMRQLRERIQGGGEVDRLSIGGCGCFLDEDDTPDLAEMLK